MRQSGWCLSSLGLLSALVGMAAGCPASKFTSVSGAAAVARKSDKVTWQRSKSGLGFRLGEIVATDDGATVLASASTLSSAEVQPLLAHLPPLEKALDDVSPGSLAPGAVPSNAPVGIHLPVEVIDKVPVGWADASRTLSVSFSKPMAAATSHGGLADATAPIVLTPKPPGRFRWIDSKTLNFEPENRRFPMATEYQVEIPAGARAADGSVLAEAQRWTFRTPPPNLRRHIPEQLASEPDLDLESLVYLEFDQRIDGKAMLAALQMKANGQMVPIRLATESEVAKDIRVQRASAKAPPEHWLAIRAIEPLPRDAAIDVIVAPGAPSAEGPLRTEHERTLAFRTYAPLRLMKVHCKWAHCGSGMPWTLVFNNPLADRTFDSRMLSVTPAPDGMQVGVNGAYAVVQANVKGRATYQINLSGAITDVYGQSLGKDVRHAIHVDASSPYLFSAPYDTVVLDAASDAKYPVFSVNVPTLEVQLRQVRPEDYAAYLDWLGRDVEKYASPPGRLVSTRLVSTAHTVDKLATTMVDLRPALQDGVGQVLVIVKRPGPLEQNRWDPQWARAWVQVTSMGLDGFFDERSVTGWVTSLRDGRPLPGVSLSMLPGKVDGISGADGLVRLSARAPADIILVARKGADVTILQGPDDREAFAPGDTRDSGAWFVFSDRESYRRDEAVHIKGFVRLNRASGDMQLPSPANVPVGFRAFDFEGAQLAIGESSLDQAGAFDVEFTVPSTAKSGRAYIELQADIGDNPYLQRWRHSFSIEERRQSRFEVTARADEGPHVVGGHALATVAVTNPGGSVEPGASVRWTVHRGEANFALQNHREYHFGRLPVSNDSKVERWKPDQSSLDEPVNSAEWHGRTDARGEHRLRVDFDALEPSYPIALGLTAELKGARHRAITSLLVHPASVTVGIKTARPVVRAGDVLEVDTIVAALDGKVTTGRHVDIRLARIDAVWHKGTFVDDETDVQNCSLTSTERGDRCAFKPGREGLYRLTATVIDEHGRRSQTQGDVRVASNDASNLGAGHVGLLANRQEYRPGEVAELLVTTSICPVEGVLTLRREGLLKVERFTMTEPTTILRVPIEAAHAPNLGVEVVLASQYDNPTRFGDVDPTPPREPAHWTMHTTLAISAVEHALGVYVRPREETVEPGGKTMVDVEVRGPGGTPVPNAQVTLWAVDEAVLANSPYLLPDPLAAFFPNRGERVYTSTPRVNGWRSSYDGLLEEAGRRAVLGRKLPGDGLWGEGDSREPSPIGTAPAKDRSVLANSWLLRSPIWLDHARVPERGSSIPELNVHQGMSQPTIPATGHHAESPLALFLAGRTTDARGHTEATLRLSGEFTRYRVMAVATAGATRFGSGQAGVAVRMPFVLRASAPEIAQCGERFDVPVVLRNQTAQSLTIDLVARARDATVDRPGARVAVPARERVEVRFNASMAKQGVARFQIGAMSGSFVDAVTVDTACVTHVAESPRRP